RGHARAATARDAHEHDLGDGLRQLPLVERLGSKPLTGEPLGQNRHERLDCGSLQLPRGIMDDRIDVGAVEDPVELLRELVDGAASRAGTSVNSSNVTSGAKRTGGREGVTSR